MSFTIPTVDDFKAQFDRDFPFAVPSFGAAGLLTVAGGVITVAALAAGGQGYTTPPAVSVIDAGTPPGTGAAIAATVANGGVTGFVIANGGSGYLAPTLALSGGSGDNSDRTRVRDYDIQQAIQGALFNVNQCLFADQASWAYAFGFLAAHNLVERMLAAGEGLRSRFNWMVTGKSAGDLSESFSIPDNIMQSSFLASLSKTRYGARYLEIISPLLIGNMLTTFRQTPP